MTDQELTRQLKIAGAVYRNRPIDPEMDERIHARVMAYVAATGGKPSYQLNFSEKFNIRLAFLRYFIPPQFAYAIGLFVLIIGSGFFAYQANTTLPGEKLYGAKIALEKTHARFVSNPSERAKVQMEFAGRRLEEARFAAPGSAPEAIKRFAQDVKAAQEALKQAADPIQAAAAQKELVQKAAEYEIKLQEVKVGRSDRPVEMAAINEAEEALKEVAKVAEVAEVAEELENGEVGL